MLRMGLEDQVSSYWTNSSKRWWKLDQVSSSRNRRDRADFRKKTLGDVEWRMTPRFLDGWQHCNMWNTTIKETFLHFGSTVLDYYLNPLLLEYIIKNSLYIEIRKLHILTHVILTTLWDRYNFLQLIDEEKKGYRG